MKSYRCEIKIKNNLLYQAMREAGYENASQLAIAADVCQTVIGRYLNLKAAPYSKTGRPKKHSLAPSVKKICELLKKNVAELFPEAQLFDGLEKNSGSIEIDEEQAMLLAGASQFLLEEVETPDDILEKKQMSTVLDSVISTLTQREAEVLRLRFGLDGLPEHNLLETAEKLNITASRVSQVESSALRKLRHSSRSDLIQKQLGINNLPEQQSESEEWIKRGYLFDPTGYPEPFAVRHYESESMKYGEPIKVKVIKGFRATVDNVFRDVLVGETINLPYELALAVISSNKAELNTGSLQ